jgi:MFS transporter, ACS family, hexuronate transporter
MRWLPVLSMMLVSVISYIDRNTLALLAPTILRDTHMSAEQYGFIVSAFSIAYMLGNPVWGVILDRIGTRRGMLASVTVWTLASVSHAFAMGFGSFAAARAVLGFGEGATFPGSMRAATQTLPVAQRSRGIALSYSGGSLGAIVTPLIVTPLALAFGWRAAFWFTGVTGALWLAHWAVLSRRPKLSRTIAVVASARETGAALHEKTPAKRVGFRMEAPKEGAILRWTQPRVWAFVAAYALGSVPLGFVLNDASLYLSAGLHKTQGEIGAVLWLPPLGWETGYFFWGWFTDRFLQSGADVKGLRKTFVLLTVLSLSLAAVPYLHSFAATMLLMFFTMFLAAGFIIGSLAYANSYYPVRHAGLIAGLGAGSWSAMVALVMPGMGRLFDLRMYGAAFLITSLFPAVALAAWWTLDRASRRGAPAREPSRLPVGS